MKFSATLLALLASTALAIPNGDDERKGGHSKKYVTSKPYEYPTCSEVYKTYPKTEYSKVPVTKVYTDYKYVTKTTEVPKHITTYKYVTKTVTKTKTFDKTYTKKEKVKTSTVVCKTLPSYTFTEKIYTTHIQKPYEKEEKETQPYTTEIKVPSTYTTKKPVEQTKTEVEKKPYTTEYVKTEEKCETKTGYKTYTTYKPEPPKYEPPKHEPPKYEPPKHEPPTYEPHH